MTSDDAVGRDDSFDADHRVLGLFADGIAGRSMHLQPTAEGERAGWPWDADAVPDGETVHLPAASGDRLARRAAVLHQAGYVEFGTADVDVAERDAVFAATHHPGLLLRLFTILEDVRVDAAVRHRYPGARRDLDVLAAAVLADEPIERPVLQRDDLVDALRQYSIGAAPARLVATALSPARAALLADLLRRAAALRAIDATADDSIRIAVEIGELVDEELPLDPEATFAVVEAPDDAKELQPPGDEPRRGDVPRAPSSDMEQGDELTRLGGQIVELLAPDPGEPEAERPEARQPDRSDLPADRRSPGRPRLPLRRVELPRPPLPAVVVPGARTTAARRRPLVHRRRPAAPRRAGEPRPPPVHVRPPRGVGARPPRR